MRLRTILFNTLYSFEDDAIERRSLGRWFIGASTPLSPDSPIRAFGAASDLEDDDQVRGLLDHVDDPKIADAKSPEPGVGQFDRAWRSRLDGQGEDRSAEACGIARWKPSELALGGGGELDVATTLAHASSGP